MLGVREDRIAVPASLARWVASISELRSASTHGQTVVRLPDATSSLVIYEDARGAVRVVAVGPVKRAFYKSTASLGRYTRISFHPGKARLALGISPRELADQSTDLLALWGHSARPLFDAVARGTLERVMTVLAHRFEDATSIASDIVQRAASALEAADAESVRAIAGRLHVSERFLRNAFRDELGISPKRHARIARIRRVAEAAATGALPWAAVATTYGFFDQAHMNAEFRDLLRTTPTAFRAGEVPASSGCGVSQLRP